MYHDFIMDEIERMTRFIAKAVFNVEMDKDEIIDIDQFSISEGSLLKMNLKKLLFGNRINEAENLLFNEIEAGISLEKLEIGFWFYRQINLLEDHKLEEADFSRQEILEGLQEIQNLAELEGYVL